LPKGAGFADLKAKNLSFSSYINKRAACIHRHVGVNFFFVNLTSVDAGDSDANRDFVFDRIGQKIIIDNLLMSINLYDAPWSKS
jgi:hypothetical protein